jgi:hypothetical protein
LFLTLGKKTGKRKLFWDNYKSNEQKPGVQKVAHFFTISRKNIFKIVMSLLLLTFQKEGEIFAWILHQSKHRDSMIHLKSMIE